eukprot:1559505-Rhodomonas_salina.2
MARVQGTARVCRVGSYLPSYAGPTRSGVCECEPTHSGADCSSENAVVSTGLRAVRYDPRSRRERVASPPIILCASYGKSGAAMGYAASILPRVLRARSEVSGSAATRWTYYVLPVYRDQSWTINVNSLGTRLVVRLSAYATPMARPVLIVVGAYATPKERLSDPDLYLAYNRLPTLQDFDGLEFSPAYAPTPPIRRMPSTD